MEVGVDKKRYYIAVIGGAECSEKVAEIAEEVGRELAMHGAVVICGGLGGVMEAVCRGASEEGGITEVGDDPPVPGTNFFTSAHPRMSSKDHSP